MSRKSILSTGLDDSKPNKRQKKEHQGKQFVQSKHFAGSAGELYRGLATYLAI